MNSDEIAKNVSAAEALRHQISEAGFSYGCLEVSLTAFGAKIDVKNVDRRDNRTSPQNEVIEKAGFGVNWVVRTDEKLEADDIDALLKGKIALDESYPDGVIVGYLWTEKYPDRPRHALAIIPDQIDSYVVMDTTVGGSLHATADQLAHLGNHVLEKGGTFEIAQIKK